MACDIRGMINDALAIKAALGGPAPVKDGWRAGIDLQSKGWDCAYGNGGVGTLSSGTAKEKKELKDACDGILADVTALENGPLTQAWGDGKFLEFLKFLIPIIIGLI